MDMRPAQPKQRAGMDNQRLRGRMRIPRRAVVYPRANVMSDVGSPARRQPKAETHAQKPVLPQPQVPEPLVKTLEQHAKHFYVPPKHPGLPRQSKSNVLLRQTVKTSSKKYRPKHSRPRKPVFLAATAVILFAIGTVTLFSNFKTDRMAKAHIDQPSKAITDESMAGGLPLEDDPPSNLDNYSVSPDLPRFLNIDKLDIKARVHRVGVSSTNELKTPSNIFDAGWYEGSAKPGEDGTVVMVGHVSGPTKQGIFHSLGSLKPGDKIKVERGDGKLFTYSVTGTELFDHDKVDMPKLLTTSVPGKPALNIITCTHRFNVRTNRFEQRRVIYAVLD